MGRTRKTQVNDGLDFEGIDFPTFVKQIDKLEKQNPQLAINFFGCINEGVIEHRLSQKEAKLERINLMLIEQEEKHHYRYVKTLRALLFDPKMPNRRFHCKMCLASLTSDDLLEKQKT